MAGKIGDGLAHFSHAQVTGIRCRRGGRGFFRQAPGSGIHSQARGVHLTADTPGSFVFTQHCGAPRSKLKTFLVRVNCPLPLLLRGCA